MNKIILCAGLLLLSASIKAQAVKSPLPADAKIMTTAETNALNGNAEPKMADGRTYSQYKAEMQAKQQQEQKATATNNKPPGLTPVNGNNTSNTLKTDVKPVDIKGTSLEVKATKPATENKATSTGPSSTDAAPANKTEVKPQAGKN